MSARSMFLRAGLMTTLLPCLLADSLRGQGGSPGNMTRLLQSSAPACSAADEAAMSQLGSGNADGTFPKYLSQCGKKNYNIFFGFNSNNFVNCVESDTGLSSSCANCFVGSAQYGADNCKWSCFWGSWCGQSCLNCVASSTAATQQCAGVPVPQATSC